LRLVEDPDEVAVHGPAHCHACGENLAGVPAVRHERRQHPHVGTRDIPPIQVRVIEHRVETKCCPGCGVETSGAFPAAVAAPVQYGPRVATLGVYLNQEQLLPLERTCAVLDEVCGCPISEGTLERAVANCHEQLAETEAAIKRGIEQAAVAHFDETGVNIGGKLSWLHVASTPDLTFYAAHPKRGRQAMDAIGVLPAFQGRAVHDGLASYERYQACTHALCNAHHLRELTFIEEQLGQPWAKDLKTVLCEVKQAVDTARGQGLTALPTETKHAFARRYDSVLEAGFQANPRPAPSGKRGRPKLGKAGSLLQRLREHKEEPLAFMHDFAVPFDNNQADRDIRMTKVREKISGCFRTTTGPERFCRIRGYISTLRKQGMPIFSALGQAIAGHPWPIAAPTPAGRPSRRTARPSCGRRRGQARLRQAWDERPPRRQQAPTGCPLGAHPQHLDQPQVRSNRHGLDHGIQQRHHSVHCIRHPAAPPYESQLRKLDSTGSLRRNAASSSVSGNWSGNE
jgi:transposase